MKKRRNKKPYNIIKTVLDQNGKLINVTSDGPEHIEVVKRFYAGLIALKPHYDKVLDRLIVEIKASKFNWESIGKELNMSRATIYRRVRDRQLNPFQIQRIDDILSGRKLDEDKMNKDLDSQYTQEMLEILEKQFYGYKRGRTNT